MAQALNGRQVAVPPAATALTVVNLARAYLGQRRYRDAEAELLSLAHPPYLKPVFAEGTEVNVPKRLSELYAAWGKSELAAEWRRKLPPDIVVQK